MVKNLPLLAFITILLLAPFTIADAKSFLISAKSVPDSYLIVIGSFASADEMAVASYLSAETGVTIKEESTVNARVNLILLGSPDNNALLNQRLSSPFAGRAMAEVAGENLLIVFADPESAKSLIDDLISHSKIFPLIAYTAIVLVLIFFILEAYRHGEVRKAKEIMDSHKIDSLINYIRKYESEGHQRRQISEWLVKYGYPMDLVKEAMRIA